MTQQIPIPSPIGSAWDPILIDASEAYTAKKDGKDTQKVRPVQVRAYQRRAPPHPLVPAINPHYVFRADLLRELVWAVWPHDGGPWTPVLLTGPQGSGKTSLVLQLAARANVPVVRVNLNVGSSVAQLKGRKGAEAGRTTFVPGVMTQALESGCWLVLDEISGATPPVALSLFPVLEPDGAVLLEEEQPPRYAVRHPDFRVFGTDNVIGADQEATRFDFAGTSAETNAALLDRFGSTLPVGYLPPISEFNMALGYVPALNNDSGRVILEGMIRVARNVREGKAVGNFSTRMVLEWARRVASGRLGPDGMATGAATVEMVLEAAYPAFLNRMRSHADRQAVVEIINRLFKKG